jgi:hypothetical protein
MSSSALDRIFNPKGKKRAHQDNDSQAPSTDHHFDELMKQASSIKGAHNADKFLQCMQSAKDILNVAVPVCAPYSTV